MAEADLGPARTAEVVIGCAELEPSLDFYIDIGFELDLISPADAPTTAVVSGFGLTVRLVVDPAHAADDWPVRLRLTLREPANGNSAESRLVAPEGTIVDVVSREAEPVLPPAHAAVEVSRFDQDDFGTGRASMAYRDLLPSRQGGRYIASHIRIAEGGPVPDYVHYHRILFQLIYCRRGWVRVVYEDQGEPFVLEPGDCVLQPPGIRHRVLEASDGLEVIEVGCPAIHDTLTDRSLDLPNAPPDPARLFGGQRFVRHVAADAATTVDEFGFTSRDVGLSDATDGMVSLRALTLDGRQPEARSAPVDSDLYFVFVDEGRAAVVGPGADRIELAAGDAVALPADGDHQIDDCSADLAALELVVRHPQAADSAAAVNS
ncbi:MAG: cupin domain-containing protein [Acidimicrobiales bacterium]